MRRFSRRRRGAGPPRGEGANPLDAERWLGRVRDAGVVPCESLEPLVHEDVPEHLAVVGRGATADDKPVVVAVSPRSAGDALLAALATGARLAEEEQYDGGVHVIAPEWTLAARRRLGWVRAELPFGGLHAVAAPALAERALPIQPEAPVDPSVVPVSQVAAQLAEATERQLFERAAGALAGLAVKHGGTLRGTARSVELVVLARRVAELRPEPGQLQLVTLQPQRSVAELNADGLASALDALEGQIRRRLNDRKVREGEDGMRARLVSVLADARGLRDPVAWPIGGLDQEEIDLIGLDTEGRPVIAVARETVTLSGVGGIMDAVSAARLSLPTVLADSRPPVRPDVPCLVIAGQAFASGALRALPGFALAHELFEIRPDRDQYAVASVASEEAMRSLREKPARRRRGRGARGGQEAEKADAEGEGAESEAEEAKADTREKESGGAGRGRSRRRRRGRQKDGEGERNRGEKEATDTEESAGDATAGEGSRFEEFSLLDLEDAGESAQGSGEGGGGRRRRGRRGRKSKSASEEAGEDGGSDPGARNGKRKRDGQGATAANDSSEEDEDWVDDALTDLSEIPDELEPGRKRRKPADDDSEEEDEEEPEEEVLSTDLSGGLQNDRSEESASEPSRPRRRAVIVARADRDSLLAAILLARDIRLLEGLWIYPQDEFMGFFREVATDLREDVPIYVVGFAPSPAIDVLQAASLYRDRLHWYDHHVWAPEDDVALKQALGEESVHHTPGAGSSLPAVLSTSTRRSRFSDKLVDLATGRFTQHDYERWGRLWWWRLGEIAGKRGDVRTDVGPLLTGRPSDLAKEAAKAETPPIPEEVAYVSKRDFRIVHFVGYGMVVAEAEPGFDLHLIGRIARERYAAQLSLVRHEGSDFFLFAGEEQAGRRVLDFGALVDHLADKLDWVIGLPSDDHIARFRIEGLAEHAGRLDEVIGEIAMGRSILER